MGRIARIVAVGYPHHVTQRGNNRADVFFSAADRKYYLAALARCCEEFKLKVWAYCLMSNHVHVVAVPEQPYSLAQGIGRTNLIYTQRVNLKYRRTGRLWQNRFFSTPVDSDEYLWAVCRYVENNPVRAHLVQHAWNYPWSSARHHVKSTPDPLIEESSWLDPSQREEYRSYLAERSNNQEELDRIRQTVQTGRPFGTPTFIAKLERRLGRILRPAKRGPKRKRRRS
jgi:putative transposase